MFKKVILPILLSTVWISISEFVRNEFLLQHYWTKHYEGLGLVFPSEPINGAIGVFGLFALPSEFTICYVGFLSGRLAF